MYNGVWDSLCRHPLLVVSDVDARAGIVTVPERAVPILGDSAAHVAPGEQRSRRGINTYNSRILESDQ